MARENPIDIIEIYNSYDGKKESIGRVRTNKVVVRKVKRTSNNNRLRLLRAAIIAGASTIALTASANWYMKFNKERKENWLRYANEMTVGSAYHLIHTDDAFVGDVINVVQDEINKIAQIDPDADLVKVSNVYLTPIKKALYSDEENTISDEEYQNALKSFEDYTKQYRELGIVYEFGSNQNAEEIVTVKLGGEVIAIGEYYADYNNGINKENAHTKGY